MLKGFTRGMKPLETLSPEELETIHGSALFTLESTGMRVESERALKLFAAGDCRVLGPGDVRTNRLRDRLQK